MPRTIRSHPDENADPAIAGGLRRRGIDVTTSHEAGLLHARDEAQVAHALAEGRVLITHDRDFLRLNATGEPHAGIAYCDKGTRTIGAMIATLTQLWETLEPETMAGRVQFL